MNVCLSPMGLARMERAYLPRIEAAEKRAAELRIPSVLRHVVRPDIARHWPTLDMNQEREVLRALMEIHVMPAGRGRRVDPVDRVNITWVR
ncbi:hypothetical protein GCM10011581_46120 [Saccharopolyspora subtropica]|uniref:Uncharacterized protein n=2 Tax=Saccharopolyspora thermophila TaxID=89367 RepID=A0A917KAI7_9PSEU|nr:hypothetical protein GCM10011581_46120 [Saccharopolyspora subtropica]